LTGSRRDSPRDGGPGAPAPRRCGAAAAVALLADDRRDDVRSAQLQERAGAADGVVHLGARNQPPPFDAGVTGCELAGRRRVNDRILAFADAHPIRLDGSELHLDPQAILAELESRDRGSEARGAPRVFRFSADGVSTLAAMLPVLNVSMCSENATLDSFPPAPGHGRVRGPPFPAGFPAYRHHEVRFPGRAPGGCRRSPGASPLLRSKRP
jgi:hypothetical protein